MEHMPDDNSRYKDVDYWDERYKTEKCFDWLGKFSKFQHLLEKHTKKHDSILVLGYRICFYRISSPAQLIGVVTVAGDDGVARQEVGIWEARESFDPEGCGNSDMSSDMYSAGYHSITNIDYSSVCINAMSARYADCPGMSWYQMDLRQLTFPDASFDVVLEKATLDAMLVEEKDHWKVSPQTACLFDQALKEISRVLKPGGRFLSVTFSQPHFRKRLYARCEYNWSIKHHTYGDGFHYFLYVLTKGEELSPEDAALERRLLEEDKAPPTPITTMQYEESESDFLGKFCL